MQIVQGKQHFPVREFTDLRQMLQQAVDRYGPQIAFRFRSSPEAKPETRTYRQFWQDHLELGTCLHHLGLAGKRIAVIGENSYAWRLAYAAVINGTGIIVPLDRLLPEDEIIELLQRGRVDTLFFDPQFLETAKKAAAKLSHLERLIALRPLSDEETCPPQAGKVHSPACCHQFQDCLSLGGQLLAKKDRSFIEAEIDAKSLASLLFTSGTTSRAKAVMLSHENLCADLVGLAAVIRLPEGIRMLSVLPLHHTFENTCGFYMALYIGAQIHDTDGLRYIQKNLNEYHIEMIIGVPILFNNFYSKVKAALKKSGKENLVSRLIPLTQALRKVGIDLRRKVYHQILAAFGGQLRLGICGAAPIDPDILSFFDAVGIRILEGYGLTEAAPVISGCNSKVFVPGTVGQPLYGVTVAVDSPKPGEPGEILARGDNIMLGYYEDETATRETIDAQGWLHTGDIGVIDPKNDCLTITGRKKSMIVLKSGKKVFPEEIEHLIGQNEWIKEAMVWGEESDEGDVVVSAKFVLDKEKLQEDEVDEEHIREKIDKMIQDINAKLPAFKGIRHYVYGFGDMVKTTTMKIKRPVELAKIKDILDRQKLKFQQLTGQNIDNYETDRDERGEGEEDGKKDDA